jgi:5-methylcytosine-specific restriction endonuclease McrA
MTYIASQRPSWQGKVKCDTARGRRLRAAVHQRDDFTCQDCGWRPLQEQIPASYDGRFAIGTWRIPADRELHLDHVYPRALGGEPVLDNLQTLCEPCNRTKAART